MNFGTDGVVLWYAGVGWDETEGTDRRIVTALAEERDVLWVDPPNKSGWGALRKSWRGSVTDNEPVARIRVPAPPAVTRRPMRAVTNAMRSAHVGLAVRRTVQAVVVANPITPMPATSRIPRVLFVTDDWVEGAGLMGLDRNWVRRTLRRNLEAADVVLAVTPRLLENVRRLLPATGSGGDKLWAVVPNGVKPNPVRPHNDASVAGLVGQINERLDLAYLHAVVDRGIRLKIIGPRTATDSAFIADFERLTARDGVEWIGAVPAEEVPRHLAQLAVGLTPYSADEFNQSSFPLKTLEYLAAGIPAVSTDLEASRWLASAHVSICAEPGQFATAVNRALVASFDSGLVGQRKHEAASHSWTVRAHAVMAAVADSGVGGRRLE
ncbi:glycosyltransferase [Gryllotalpicola protaetiae]|uniref:Glycosyltransferase n=1 Tax=Gryllotalpicola protaetiae TaxID=2419771 RepID=A0A387BQ91_9MICO|nr:glycosyltransferase [Gryllotalpicola protaetiae]AYG03187.1 glycosyltransferase [Gryllotalpicola protaetiae]